MLLYQPHPAPVPSN